MKRFPCFCRDSLMVTTQLFLHMERQVAEKLIRIINFYYRQYDRRQQCRRNNSIIDDRFAGKDQSYKKKQRCFNQAFIYINLQRVN
jgi:hypothetical protein